MFGRIPAKPIVFLAVLMAAVVIAPPTVSAQACNRGRNMTTADGSDFGPAEADAVHERAYGLFHNRKLWPEAGRLLHEVALCREPSDPTYVWDMFDAARVFLNSSLISHALNCMAQTGTRAVEVGDLPKGAHAYLNAAILARRLGQEEVAIGFVRSAQELAKLPKLHGSERDGILLRIKDGGRKVIGEPDWIP